MRTSGAFLEHEIELKKVPDVDHEYSGIIVTMQVDANATGIGAALYVASDGNLEEADADGVATMPCIALALEAGTGSKKVLLLGIMRDDTWNWTPGALIYVDDDPTGGLTQTQPAGAGDQVQIVGRALTEDTMFFNPSPVIVEHA